MIDYHTFIGPYPFRHLPHPNPDVLVSVLDRESIDTAWVGHLPSAFYRDPAPGNEELAETLAPHRKRLIAVPTVRPDWPAWERTLQAAVDAGAAAIRAYPPQWGMGPHDASMRRLAGACGEIGVPLVLTTRFEDARQRSALDNAGELTGAAIRLLARADARTTILVTAAGRALVEEVHWGLTRDERDRVWWDISWIWGPPEDHLTHLFRTIGAERFVYGSGWPLRLVQTPRANLELLDDDVRGAHLGQVSAARA